MTTFKKTNLALLVAAVFAAPVAYAIELTDYTEPDSFYDEAYITGQFNLKSGNQPETSYNATAFGYYDMLYSTKPTVWDFRFDGKLDFEKGSEDGAENNEGYDFLAVGSMDNYFGDTNGLLWYGSAELGYRQALGSDDADDPYAKIGAGIGYGRIIDATPLAEVLRFIDELEEYGVLTGEVSDAVYLELAQIVARESEYKSRYGLSDYEQYWIEDLEKVLAKTNLLKGGKLGAVGVLKINDVLFEERINVRRHGWLAKAGISYLASNYDGSDNDPALDLSFEYAHPFDHRLQLIELAQYSTIFADDAVHNFRNTLSLTYEVSDRIDWENQWRLSLVMPTAENSNDIIRNDLSSIFRYEIDNQLDANLTLSLTDVEDDIDNNGNDDLDVSLFVGVTYRLR